MNFPTVFVLSLLVGGSVASPNLKGSVAAVEETRSLQEHAGSDVCSFSPFGKPTPMCMSVPYTHAHNDYEHANPLFDALSYGFRSGEADIFLYENDGGNLRVAHDPVDDPTTLQTIEELYLDPLAAQFHYHDNKGIYADGSRFHLLIDLKTGGDTYPVLHEKLADYALKHPGLITTYFKTGDNEWEVIQGAVDMTISGNRPREYMLAQETRYATYDGRMADIGSDVSPHFLMLLSDNWNRFFGDYGWNGEGEMPEEIKAAIKDTVETVHAEGRLLRFWNLPSDTPNVWGPLVDAGVDFVNTDRLGPLSTFIQSEGACSYAPFGKPLPRCEQVPFTHAHNDYEHPNPLFDAMSHGFSSAEADIFLYENDGGNLRVAHDPVDDPTTLHTLEELYLDPLAAQFHYHDNGGLYADGSRMHLLIDLKTGGETYPVLHEKLAAYAETHPGLITMYRKISDNEWEKHEGAVDMTISGNRPRELMLGQEVRYATYDGRMADMGSDVSPDFLMLLSDNWNRFFGDFGWDGQGEMPTEIKNSIIEVTNQVHSEGRLLRFWNLPSDTPNVWGPLVEAGVDFVNTDRLEPLSTYIQGTYIC